MTIKSVKTKFRLLLAEDKAAKSKNISHKAKKAKTGAPTRKSLRQNPDGNGQNNEDNSLSHEPISGGCTDAIITHKVQYKLRENI